jgi:esterase
MLASTITGRGPRRVVVLHGFLGSARNFGLLAQLWSERDPTLSIVTPDLPGHGASPPLSRDADIEGVARDVLAFTRGEGGAEPFTVVGYSLGGRIALAMRLMAPRSFSRIVLLDSTPANIEGRSTELTDALGALLEAPEEAPSREAIEIALIENGMSPGLVVWLMMNVVFDAGVYRWKIDRQTLCDIFERSRRDDLWSAVKPEECAIHLIRGEESDFVREEDAKRLIELGGTTVTIAGAGHFLHVQKPSVIVDALVDAVR